jgi:hypothetical protein
VEISFRNTVKFFKKELMKVENGVKATEIFTDKQRKSLVKTGILRRKYGRGGCRLKLTKKAKQILEN